MTKNLTRLVSFVLYTGSLAACGGTGTPTQPTLATAKETQSTVTTAPPPTTTPAPTPAPRPGVTLPPWVLSGPSDCMTSPPAKLQWTLTVNDAEAGIHLVTNTFHDRTAGCNATQAEAFTGLTVAGPRDYAAGAKGETVLTFDPAELTCGRAQVDVALNGTLIVGMLVNSGRDCAPPSSPAPKPPAPTPPPGSAGPDTCALHVDFLNQSENEGSDSIVTTYNARVSWTSSATLATLYWGDGKSQPVSNQGGYNHAYVLPEYASNGTRTGPTSFTLMLSMPISNGQCDARATITIVP